MVFKSEKDVPKVAEISEKDQTIMRNAYRLLHGWQTAPGTDANAGFDGQRFQKWLEEVDRRTKESGHFKVARDQIGQVLPYAPPDPDGLWIHSSVAEALNSKDAAGMRSGFIRTLYNTRGVHGFTAGREEREIAERYNEKADGLEEHSYHRFASAVRDLAKDYERQADREAKTDPFEQ